MSRPLKLFSFFAASSFLLGSAGYMGLHAVMPHGVVFGRLYRMFLYHEAHPFQYIAVVSFTYAIIATLSGPRCSRLTAWRRRVAILSIVAASILIASIPGGVLWKVHDMQAGYFTTGARFWSDLQWGASMGLRVGWLIAALSLPYSIVGLLVGYVITDLGFKLAAWSEPS
jgi:hypothetical protein